METIFLTQNNGSEIEILGADHDDEFTVYITEGNVTLVQYLSRKDTQQLADALIKELNSTP
jgi:hypothetical protein